MADGSMEATEIFKPKILLITMARSSYLAADALGQLHLNYPANVYIVKTLYPGILPKYYFLNSFKKGIHGIIIASAGSDCPIAGSYSLLVDTIKYAQAEMKEQGMSVKRLRLTSICSVCTSALMKEIKQMTDFLVKQKQEGKL